MCKSVILQINDILKLYKQLSCNKHKKQEIEIYLKSILVDLWTKFDDIYRLKLCEIDNTNNKNSSTDISNKNVIIENNDNDNIENNVIIFENNNDKNIKKIDTINNGIIIENNTKDKI